MITGNNFPTGQDDVISLFLFGRQITPLTITTTQISFNSPNLDIQSLTSLEPLTIRYYKSQILKTSFVIDNFFVDGVYYDTTKSQFMKCDPSCKKCTNSIACQTCNTNYIRIENDNTLCYLNYSQLNLNGKYYYNNNNFYSLCSQICLGCVKTPGYCTECNKAGGYYPKVDESSVCLLNTSSPVGYYFDSAEMHKKCDISCSTCNNSSMNCILCNTENLYYPRVDKSNSCLHKDSSPDGYYFNSNTLKHEKCDFSCTKCSLQEKKCIECNKAGSYYPKVDELSACLNNSKFPNYFFILECVKASNGYYLNKEKSIFSKCFEGCIECEDSKLCLKCNTTKGYYELKNSISSDSDNKSQGLRKK